MTAEVHRRLARRPAFADVLVLEEAANPGVFIGARDGLRIAAVLARKGRNAALAERVRERFGLELPHGPYRSIAGDLALAGTGPGAWLATSDRDCNTFAQFTRDALADVASVSEQSDAYAAVRLSGMRIRDTLCRLMPIDIHPRVFKVGDVAVTTVAHMSATLWRLDDQADGAGVFEIAVFRSLAKSFWHLLHATAAQFGLATLSGAGPDKGAHSTD